MSSYWRRRADLLIGHRVPPEAPVPPVRPASASIAMLVDNEFRDRPFGSHGAMLTAPVPEPPAPPTTGLRIEPPPWQAELEAGDAIVVRTEAQADELSALQSIRVDEGDIDWPVAPGPPMLLAPLTRPMIPEVDWRAEERERAARQLEPIEEPARSLQRRPA